MKPQPGENYPLGCAGIILGIIIGWSPLWGWLLWERLA